MVLTKSTVEIEKEETVKLDFAPTPEANPNDADMVEGYGVRFVKGDDLEGGNCEPGHCPYQLGGRHERENMLDLADKTRRMKVKKEMSAEDQDKAIYTVGIKIYKSGARKAVKSMRKANCHADVDVSIDEGTEETEEEGMEEGDDSQDEEAEKKEAEEPSNTQPAETHNQLGVAQGRNALNTKTM